MRSRAAPSCYRDPVVPDWDVPAAFKKFHARRPRLAGLVTMTAAAVMMAWNYAAETGVGPMHGYYYPAAYLIAYPGLFIGLWIVITGRSVSGEQRPPGWWLAVAGIGLLGALAYGIYALLQAHP
jgi:hypothetical protein